MHIDFATNRNPDNAVNLSDFGAGFSTAGQDDLCFDCSDMSGQGGQYSLNVGLDKSTVGDLSSQALGNQSTFEVVEGIEAPCTRKIALSTCMSEARGFRLRWDAA